MILLVITLLCSSGFAACRTTASSSSDEGGAAQWNSTNDESACELGYFDLLTIRSLTFSEHNRVETGRGSEKQLQCVKCDVGGTPLSANCTSFPDTSQEEGVSWRCVGEFSNNDYYIDSADVKCENQKKESPRGVQCKRNGSCILHVTTRKRLSRVLYFSNAGMPWWPFLIMGLSFLLFFVVCGAALYRHYLIQKALMQCAPQQVIRIYGGGDCRIYPEPPAGPSVPFASPNIAPPPYEAMPGKFPQNN